MKCVIVVLSLLLIAAGSTPALGKKVPDPGQLGPYKVGFSHRMLLDDSRDTDSEFGGRPIPVYLWYPADPEDITSSTAPAVYPMDPIYGVLPPTTSTDWELYGLDAAYQVPPLSSDAPFPVVMFSPGWTFPAWLYIYVGTRLASHGFVVAALTHYGDGVFPEAPWHHMAVASLNRPLDVSFALTHLLEANDAQDDPLYDLIRPSQIGVSGHSLGGYAAMTLAGGDDEVCDKTQGQWPGQPPAPPSTCVPSPPDPRFKVLVPLDGSNQLLWFHELARIEIPAMGIGQEWDSVESWQARQHAAFSGHPSYRVDLYNSHHFIFANLCQYYEMIGITNDPVCTDFIPSLEAQRLVTQYMVAFLKTKLAGETGYQNMLTPGWALTREDDIEFFVTEKKNSNAIYEDWPCCFFYFPHQPGSEHAQAYRDPEEALPIPYGFLWP